MGRLTSEWRQYQSRRKSVDSQHLARSRTSSSVVAFSQKCLFLSRSTASASIFLETLIAAGSVSPAKGSFSPGKRDLYHPLTFASSTVLILVIHVTQFPPTLRS